MSKDTSDNALMDFLKTNFTQLNRQLEEVKVNMKETKNAIKKVTEETENNKKYIKSNSVRIMALEAIVGDPSECVIPLNITIQNVPKIATHDDLDVVKNIIININADDVHPNTDVIKVIRKGYKSETANQKEKLGTLCVELKSTEVRSKIMRAKKILATLPDEGQTKGFRNFKVKNMLSQQDLNQQYTNRTLLKMVPGGDRFYIAGNGALKPIQAQGSQHPHHHSQYPLQQPHLAPQHLQQGPLHNLQRHASHLQPPVPVLCPSPCLPPPAPPSPRPDLGGRTGAESG